MSSARNVEGNLTTRDIWIITQAELTILRVQYLVQRIVGKCCLVSGILKGTCGVTGPNLSGL